MVSHQATASTTTHVSQTTRLISTDSRAKDYVARWNEEGVHEAVLPKTTQCLWPGQPNSLLAWMKDHEPESIERAGWVLMAKDYTRFRLTGKK